MGRILGIAVLILLLIFAGYKIFSGRVDRTDPHAVATAFLKSLKAQDVSDAKDYYLPAEADAWAASAKETLQGMRSNATAMFNDSIPDHPQFVTVPSPKGSTDTTYQAGGVNLSLRQVDSQWYVSRSPY